MATIVTARDTIRPDIPDAELERHAEWFVDALLERSASAPPPNHGSPKYLVSAPASEADRKRVLALLADELAAEAARGPVTCPRCGDDDVRGEDATPPRYTCRTCRHRWYTAVVVLE